MDFSTSKESFTLIYTVSGCKPYIFNYNPENNNFSNLNKNEIGKGLIKNQKQSHIFSPMC